MLNVKTNENNNDIYDTLLSLHPHFDTGIADYNALHRDRKAIVIKAVTGFVLFFAVFLVGIPLLVKNIDNEELLLAYISNVDLIATIMSFKNGPFGQDLFRYLYMDPRPLIGYINQNLINLYVLIALSYVVSSIAVKNKSVSDGMAKASIIYVLTYLFPGRFISEIMHWTYNSLASYFPESTHSIIYYLTICVGSIFSIGLIIMEAIVTKMIYKDVSRLYKKII